jgi:RecB family exonuclease
MTKIPEILPDPTLESLVNAISGQCNGRRTVIVCESQLMVRRVRRLFQYDDRFSAPSVTTIHAWLEEMTLLHLPAGKLPARILPPAELEWFIAGIIASLDDLPPIFSSPEGLKSVSRWLHAAASRGFTLETLTEPFAHEKNDGFPTLLRAIVTALQQWRFLPRSFVTSLATACSTAAHFPECVVLWHIQSSDPARDMALRHWKNCARATSWIEISQEPIPEELSLKEAVLSIGDKFHYFEPHTTELEIDRIFREIAAEIAFNSKLPGDAVILVPDVEAARPHALRMAAETGIPLYISKGDRLIALPLIRRFLLLLEFLGGDDDINHLVQVFGDNLLHINAFSGITTHAPPKVREFGQKSRSWNRRTLSEMKALLETRDDKGGLIETVLQHTGALQKRFRFPKKQPLSAWLRDSFVPVFMAQPALGGEIAGNLRNALVTLAIESAKTLELLHSDRQADIAEALAFFRLVVSGASEPNSEKPDAVLLTQPSQFSLTHGKLVFAAGMNGESWPDREPSNFLQYSWPEQAAQVFPESGISERWTESVNRFWAICSTAERVVASCPGYGANGAQAPSPLFVEIRRSGAPILSHAAFNVRQVDIERDERRFPAASVAIQQPAGSARLSAFVRNQRALPVPGVYDGLLSSHPAALAAIRERLTNREDPFTFSATTIDRYILSPHGFMLYSLLGVREPDEYRELLDPEEKGTLMHSILEAFYSESADFSPKMPLYNPATDWHGAKERLQIIRDTAFAAHQHIFSNTSSPFFPKLKEDITRTLDAWLVEERDKKRNGEKFRDYIPAPLHPDGSLQMPPELAFTISLDDAAFPCEVSGYIDRIDIRNSPPYDAIVTDYKTGSVSRFNKTDVITGMRSQMPLYQWALMSIHHDKALQMNGASYWGIKPGSRFPEATSIMVLEASAKSRPPVSYDELQAIPSLFVDNRLRWIAEAIYNGVFNLPLYVDEYAPLKELSRINTTLQLRRLTIEKMEGAQHHASGLLYRFYAPVKLLAAPTATPQPD